MHIADHFQFGHWHPMTTAPYNQAVELRVLDHGNVVTLPFPCLRNNADHSINSDLGAPILIESDRVADLASLGAPTRRLDNEDAANRFFAAAVLDDGSLQWLVSALHGGCGRFHRYRQFGAATGFRRWA